MVIKHSASSCLMQALTHRLNSAACYLQSEEVNAWFKTHCSKDFSDKISQWKQHPVVTTAEDYAAKKINAQQAAEVFSQYKIKVDHVAAIHMADIPEEQQLTTDGCEIATQMGIFIEAAKELAALPAPALRIHTHISSQAHIAQL